MEWLERHQVMLALVSLAFGAAVGLLVPAAAHPASVAITPSLALLLYATFLGVPFAQIGRALRDGRFLATVIVVNFVAVPVVAFFLSRIVAHDRALLVGVLLVLLTPCVDYVIVFAGLAGGARDRLLAASPLLMLAQALALPPLLRLFAGADVVGSIDPGPFLESFAMLIVAPLAAAALTQAAAARWRWGALLRRAGSGAMVPVMMVTLAVVVASQIADVGGRLGSLLLVLPVFLLFAAVMTPIGLGTARLFGLDVPGRRAVAFSGVTRNSLVILPLALALPAAYELAPLVVVTQTLVELVVMAALVRLMPLLARR